MKGGDATTAAESVSREKAPRPSERAADDAHPTVFVITLWLEQGGAAAKPEWRWRVREVRSGEEALFRRVSDVLAYVAARSGGPGPG
ncbi:MAG TPA: hypothetical protein VFU72_00275 [Nitrolancea sp.]|nr:hypothetical protein [Nitrolancea sp.]